MLMVFCILFPPLIPFAMVYYLFGNRRANRDAARATRHLEQTELRRLEIEKHANLLRFTALTPEQREEFMEAAYQAKWKRQRDVTTGFIFCVLVLLLTIYIMS